MKKFVALALALVLVFSMGVPSFAVDVTVTESGVYDDIYSGTVNDTVYTTRNPLEMIILFLQGISDRLGIMGYSLTSIVDKITTLSGYFTFDVPEIAEFGNGNMYDMMSTFHFLGIDIQGMNYFTPYSGGQATSLDEALNKNLLYIQNQLQVISDSMGATASSGLMSGWSLSGVPAPEGYSTSWYYRVLQNVGSLSTYFNRLYGGTWANSENYADSFFYQTFLQNKIISDNVSNLITGWNKGDIITSPGEYSESWYYWVFDNLNGMLENSELFEDTYLEKNNFQYLNFNTAGLTYEFKYNGTFADAVTKSLSYIGQSLTFKLSTSFDNPFSSSGKTTVNSRYGTLDNMIQHLNHQSGFLARLAYVLADDEEIRLNQTLQDSKTEVVDFVGEGVTSSSGSSFSIMSGLTDGVEFSSSFFEFFDMGISLDDVWLIFEDDEAFSWFTEETASNIDTVPVTYSRKPNPQTEIVTSYYEDRQMEFAEKWGALIG